MPVIFQPWIGHLYRANNRFGIRVLVLGRPFSDLTSSSGPLLTRTLQNSLNIARVLLKDDIPLGHLRVIHIPE